MNKVKYYTSHAAGQPPAIIPIIFDSESTIFVTVAGEKYAKVSKWGVYHESWRAARLHSIEKEQSAVNHLADQLREAKDRLRAAMDIRTSIGIL